jgi:ribosomal protein S18 acetylase RimI-like enzyme
MTMRDRTSLQIRQAVPADAPALAAVQIASWQVAYRDIVSQRVMDAWNAKRPAQWESYLAAATPKTQNLLAQQGDEVIGFALFGPGRDEGIDAQRNAELYSLYVHPSQWRHGAGRALCAAVIERLADQNFADLYLWTFAANAPARRFYESVGFQLQSRAKELVLEGTTFAEVCYARCLR